MISAEVKKAELDENGNIKVETEYTLTDGSKKIGHTRYNALNFSKAAIQKDIDTHCETLMTRVYMLKRNQELVNTTVVNDLSKSISSCEIVTKPAVYDKDNVLVTPAEKLTIDDK